MAKILGLHSKVGSILNQIYEESRIADQSRELEYIAAVKIQSWYRGLTLRTYLKYLRNNAIKVQRAWRGYVGRCQYRIVLDNRVKQMRINFYNQKACLIQKCWRGFYSRKYYFDFYKRKAYLLSIQHKNEGLLKELREYKDYMDRQREEKRNLLKYKRLEDTAKRNHYMVSTKQIPGIYNSPYRPVPTDMEYLMQNVKLDPPAMREVYAKSIKANNFDAIPLPTGLPPLNTKPQGPFREPLDVRRQRYRPLSPSLRVESDFESVLKARQKMKDDEKIERIHEEIFLPVDKNTLYRPRTPLALPREKFVRLKYGTKHFRSEVDPNKFIGDDFKSQVPTIAEFHKLNRTYAERHYYIS